jgi:uncharacterized membrane protein
MSDTTAPAPRRRRFWLIASLCFNVFLIGVIVMGLIVARNRIAAQAMGGGGAGGGFRPDIVLRMLPPSGALKMCDALAKRTPTYRRLGQDYVEARRAMFRVFRAEPFDQAAFKAALDRVTAAEMAVARERADTTAEVVAQLTAEERSHFSRQTLARLAAAARGERPGAQQPGALKAICKELGAPSANDLPQ